MEMNFFWMGLGLAALGYFIGDGLKNFSKPQRKSKYPYLIKEKDLHYHFHLSKGEIEELLTKYPGAPKIELKGTTYYPYHQFVDWLSSNEIYKV
ncbi:DNA-binding protein [Priestia megaterium]|uniref:DNA-binding protein n=1 Tax=Priestia megaterium TaxID=1404 RepID=UPI000CA38B2C|nr:DNA-binding protein [Priestia megaterium]AUO10538.1 DNA-binding protein [Priestia megaterium]TJZ36468.1 DNA-binding protein [Priestia megaterium]USD15044.1 DNA-binding protein [Priestia megaterium]